MQILEPNIETVLQNADSEVLIHRTQHSRINEIDMNNIPFGRIFSDHMLVAMFDGKKWEKPKIIPYGDLRIAPSVSALNYGQAIFEGMKAHKSPEGEVLLFRPERNVQRMNFSAERLCMPRIPEDLFLNGLRELIHLDQQWIPNPDQGTLYIRPVYFATDEYVGIRPSDTYAFVIYTCPVGPYYTEPVNLLVSKEFVRAAPGGVGNAKAAGNYAAALLADKLAKERGYHNVLWLDAYQKRYIEECGTMNVFFVIDDTVVTPVNDGTILSGITRDSVMHLLKENGYKLECRQLSIYEIEEAHEKGILQEAFGTGTAATIAHIAKIGFNGRDMILPPLSERKIGNWLQSTLQGIKSGTMDDPHGWVEKL